MIAADLPRVIRERVCSEISVVTINDADISVAMPLTFGDGDTCRLFVRRESADTFTVTDGGHVLALAFMEGVNLLSTGHADRFRRIASFYGATEQGGELSMTATLDELGDTLFSLTQACIELSRLTELPPETMRPKRTFSTTFTRIVERLIPSRERIKGWFDDLTDPKGIYRSDYRVVSRGIEWLIMGAGSSNKCWKAASTVQHHRASGREFQTVFAFSEAVEHDFSAYAALLDNATIAFPLEKSSKSFRRFLRENLTSSE